MAGNIKKRKIFYLGGYDPRGDRHYYKNYKEEALKYSSLSNYEIEISSKKTLGKCFSSFQINNKGLGVKTEYCFLKWDDLIRKTWTKGLWAVLYLSMITSLSYLFNFNWKKLFKTPIRVWGTVFHSHLIIGLLIASICILIKYLMFNDIGLIGKLVMGFVGITVCYLLLKNVKSFWLFRFFIFNHRALSRKDNDIEERLKLFSNYINEELKKDNFDEYILIAHSNGTIFSVDIMKNIAKLNNNRMPKGLKLLTLGNWVPFTIIYNKSNDYQEYLRYLAKIKFTWFDISYPLDGAGFAMVNNFKLMDIKDYKVNFKNFSPRFFKYFSKENYKKIKRDKFIIHFQYLTCPDILSKYNYIQITTSDKNLEEQMAVAD